MIAARILAALLALLCATALADPLTVGWVEPVRLLPDGLVFAAKLDTGADHSSLDAQRLSIESRNGVDHALFEVRDRDGRVTLIDRPVLRYATVRRHAGASQRRPVVLLDLCLGTLRKRVEVNLVDRGGFRHELLVGRSFLAPELAVDSAREATTRPSCSAG